MGPERNRRLKYPVCPPLPPRKREGRFHHWWGKGTRKEESNQPEMDSRMEHWWNKKGNEQLC